MRAVNLLPRDEQRARIEGARLPLFLAAGGVVAVTLGAVVLASSAGSSADELRSELAAVEAQIAAQPRAAEPALSQGMLMQERTDRVAALSAALSTRFAFDKLLNEISYVLPGEAWLTRLEASAPLGATPAAPAAPPAQASAAVEGVSISGATYSHDTVALVLARLSIVPSLQNVRLTASTLVEPQSSSTSPLGDRPGATSSPTRGKPFVTFVISASLKTGAS